MIKIIVKGSSSDAQDAATKRKIPFKFLKSTPGFDQSIGLVPDEFYDAILSWFSENNTRELYENGDCLFYRFLSD